MTDIAWPPGLYPESMVWSLSRNQQRATSPYSNTIQRNDRGGDVWTCRIQMPSLSQKNSALMTTWLDQISKAGNAGLVPVFQNMPTGQTGSAPFAEIQTPWWLRDPSLDWTATQLIAPPYLRNRDVTLYAGPGAATGTEARITRTFSVTAGVPYLVTVDIPPQPVPGGYRVSDGAGTLVDARATPPGAGRFRHVVSPASAALTITLYAGNGRQPFVSSQFTTLSLKRVFRIQDTPPLAGSSSFTAIGGVLEGGAAMLTHGNGQFVNVQTEAGWELKRLQGDVDMIGTNTLGGTPVAHLGRMVVEPAFRALAATGGAVEHGSPTCRMIVTDAVSTASITAPLRSGFSFDMIEDPT